MADRTPLFNLRFAQLTLVLAGEYKMTIVYYFACNCVVTQTTSGRLTYGPASLCNHHRKELIK